MIQAFATSDIGKARQINEDSYFASRPDDEVQLFIVADGMGGYKGGEIASSMAVKAARNYILSNFEKSKIDKETLLSLVKSISQYANMVVYEKAKIAIYYYILDRSYICNWNYNLFRFNNKYIIWSRIY